MRHSVVGNIGLHTSPLPASPGPAEHGALLRPLQPDQAAGAVQGVGGQTHERVLGPGRPGECTTTDQDKIRQSDTTAHFQEKEEGLEVSPMCDRATANVEKSQVYGLKQIKTWRPVVTV